MKNSKGFTKREISALKVQQWLKEWDKVKFNPKAHQRKPEDHFYIFSLSASSLKALSGIQRRTIKEGTPRALDLGIQRRHDELRSQTIAEFIQYGYPWSDLSEAKRKSGRYDALRKPGWLPTAIVVNILKAGDKRRGQTISDEDLINIDADRDQATLVSLPKKFSGTAWKPVGGLHPIEVIDGQHRLWAFSENIKTDDYELPVVAFHGLDISWQAYLFWTINIKPKRINASLAFDLYPLLRTEDWLEQFEGHSIYRETRAQELVEALWSHPDSPWHQWINMLGESGMKKPMVTQAAWIRALMAAYIKSWEGRGVRIGGLFGAPVGKDKEVLPWSRAQQAAFLIFMGQKIRDEVKTCHETWATNLRKTSPKEGLDHGHDPAFYGPFTLLATDQGIRGLLIITNDLLYVLADHLDLESWESAADASATDERAVSKALQSLKNKKVDKFLSQLATCLAKYDWRSSSAPGLSDDERTLKAAFRGSGGYRELRGQLLKHLLSQPGDVGRAASQVKKSFKS
jgi:hypothetical protein